MNCPERPRRLKPAARYTITGNALAHEALHWDIEGTFTRTLAELEAESVAYVVCRHFGVDSEVRSSRYIALWNGDGKSLRVSLERIANTARELIHDVENLTQRKAVA